MKFIITGGAGFIGSAVIRNLIRETEHTVLNLDKLTYSGNLGSLNDICNSDRYQFAKADIINSQQVRDILSDFRPDIVMNLAAESHVDRSIDRPGEFINTNIVGTYHLLEEVTKYWQGLDYKLRQRFRLHHVSTDEVYGDLQSSGSPFKENSEYQPNSPYSASKASADHLVRAWNKTFGLPTVITNCSNNYGGYQFPEKFIPHTIINAIFEKPIPIYGDGKQIRDWLFVEDHAKALVKVATCAQAGERFNIGASCELSNLEVANQICNLLQEICPELLNSNKKFCDLITHVCDRPGHDLRYAIDSSLLQERFNWEPEETFQTGLRKTVLWYVNRRDWWEPLLSSEYSLARQGKGEKL